MVGQFRHHGKRRLIETRCSLCLKTSVICVLSAIFAWSGVTSSANTNFDVYTYIVDYWRNQVAVFRNFQYSGNIAVASSGSGDSVSNLDITPDHTRIYVTNNQGNKVSALVVDPESSQYAKEIATIKTSSPPLGVRIHPDGTKVYVAAGRDIVVIDCDPDSPTYHTVLKTLTLQRYTFDLDFSPGGDLLFVVCEGAPPENIAVVETLTDVLVDTDQNPSNGTTNLSIGQFFGGSAWFRAMRIGPHGFGYLLNTGDSVNGYGSGNTITVFDSATLLPVDVDNDPETTTPGMPDGITSIVLPDIIPVSLSFSPDGNELYVVTRGFSFFGRHRARPKGKVLVLDTDPSSLGFNRILRVSDAGTRPEGVGVSPTGGFLFVSLRDEGLIRVFDRKLRALTTVPVDYPGIMVSVLRPKKVLSNRK
jgi:YVTN family beta-propeller protein